MKNICMYIKWFRKTKLEMNWRECRDYRSYFFIFHDFFVVEKKQYEIYVAEIPRKVTILFGLSHNYWDNL